MKTSVAQSRDRYVYVIPDQDGTPCYIGVGRGRRINIHLEQARRGQVKQNAAKCRFLIDCLSRGFEPIPFKVAEDLSIEESAGYERTLIAWYGRRDLGTGCLFNASSGGAGMKDLSKESREKIGQKLRGQKRTPEVIAKISEGLRRRVWTPESRAKIVASRLGKPHSEQTKINISKAAKGKIRSDETRSRMSIAKMGHPVSLETRAKVGNAHRGRTHSVESKLNMAAGQRRRYEKERSNENA